ncbi:MAG: trimeric intracellular cation channel family protein [Burkholderiales bacterium]|nr:trimeric intracellular cation channel family protein [Pseudomonadota bacterium]MCC7067493.1 trimeric intracellular cation channel family protein [Burkholderiales bacterium]MCZ2134131.1 trimeric intracellular cation channel family protein [Burkholderiales bacterium]
MNPLVSQTLSTAQTIIEMAATAAFALSGIIVGARKQLDVVGIAVVAFLAAFGGGTLRDVLLDRRPFFWVANSWYVWAVLALCVMAIVTLRRRHLTMTERAMQWPDACGLGLFAASGTQIALDAGMPGLIAVLMGVLTAVFGGVLRDIVCNEIPTAFRDHRPYAVCAFAGGAVVVAIERSIESPTFALAFGAVLATTLRALAIRFDWELPRWQAK